MTADTTDTQGGSYASMQFMYHGDERAHITAHHHEGRVFLTVGVRIGGSDTKVTFSGSPDAIEQLLADCDDALKGPLAAARAEAAAEKQERESRAEAEHEGEAAMMVGHHDHQGFLGVHEHPLADADHVHTIQPDQTIDGIPPERAGR